MGNTSIMSDLPAGQDGDLRDTFGRLQDSLGILGMGAEDVGTIKCGDDFIWGRGEVAFDTDFACTCSYGV